MKQNLCLSMVEKLEMYLKFFVLFLLEQLTKILQMDSAILHTVTIWDEKISLYLGSRNVATAYMS